MKPRATTVKINSARARLLFKICFIVDICSE